MLMQTSGLCILLKVESRCVLVMRPQDTLERTGSLGICQPVYSHLGQTHGSCHSSHSVPGHISWSYLEAGECPPLQKVSCWDWSDSPKTQINEWVASPGQYPSPFWPEIWVPQQKPFNHSYLWKEWPVFTTLKHLSSLGCKYQQVILADFEQDGG